MECFDPGSEKGLQLKKLVSNSGRNMGGWVDYLFCVGYYLFYVRSRCFFLLVIIIQQISQNGCTNITPEVEGIRRPSWAQIEADLCVSDMGGYFLHLTTRWSEAP